MGAAVHAWEDEMSAVRMVAIGSVSEIASASSFGQPREMIVALVTLPLEQKFELLLSFSTLLQVPNFPTLV